MTICTPWRVGNALNKLLAQVNELAPNRLKGADGGIGDPAHQTEQCASQHNSCCVRLAGIWIIRARDFTHDPAGGFDSYAFAEQLRLSRDPRIRYIISKKQITGPNYGWKWAAYGGSDPHLNHAHVSVWDDQPQFDNTAPWRIVPPAPPAAAKPQEAGEMIYTISDPGAPNQVLFHDILGKPVVHTTRCLATPNGPIAYDYSEIIEWFTATPHATVNITWARLNAICEQLKQPQTPVTFPPQPAPAPWPADAPEVFAEAVMALVAEKLGTVQP